MFWIGMLVGIIIAIIACIGILAYSCWKVYGTWDTFESMVYLTEAACTNRESVVEVYHNGELLSSAVFEEL